VPRAKLRCTGWHVPDACACEDVAAELADGAVLADAAPVADGAELADAAVLAGEEVAGLLTELVEL
jgi:hypothetical protein